MLVAVLLRWQRSFNFLEVFLLGNKKTTVYLHPPSLFVEQLRRASSSRLVIWRLQIGALSSAGSEHLPYKQGVTGSNPVGPTSSRKPTPIGVGFSFPVEHQVYLIVRRGKKKQTSPEKGW